MKLFKLHTDIRSYKYPIIRILMCLVIIAISIMRNRIIHISNVWISFIIGIVAVVLSMVSVLCIYLSAGELFYVYANRKKTDIQSLNLKVIKTDKIYEMVLQNDIVEMEVYVDNQIITIGSSADCKQSDYIFRDKKFYIANDEYGTIDQFKQKIEELFPDGDISVISMDGIPIEKCSWKNIV